MKKKKKTGFERFAIRLFVLSFTFFVAGIVGLNSYETNLNIKCSEVEDEISTLESNIDTLDMEIQDLASFSRIKSVASSKGYTYRQSSVATTIVGESE